MYKSLCAIMLAATSVCSDARLATTLQPSMISMHILLSVCVLIAHRRARSSALVRSQGTGRWAVAIAWPKSLSNGFSPYAATHRLHASGRPLHHARQVSADNPTPAQRCTHSHGRIQWSTSRNANNAIRYTTDQLNIFIEKNSSGGSCMRQAYQRNTALSTIAPPR